MEYSAGLTSKLFWLQESRKTAAYILEGLSKADHPQDCLGGKISIR